MTIISFVSFSSSTPVQAAAPFGGNSFKRLSLYNETLQIFDAGPVEVQLGNAGRDIYSSGRLYIRPNGSDRGSFFEGAAGQAAQRLELTGGVNGAHTLEANWAGSNGINVTSGAVTAHFDGAVNNSVGNAIYGEVASCGGPGLACYAGYFSGGNHMAVMALSQSAAGFPSLQVTNSDPAGLAARFEGDLIAGTVETQANARGACAWENVSSNELICSSDRILAGVRNANLPDPIITDLYCCEL